MPLPLNNPPPSNEAGALLQPRQLQRWLDVNPVNVLTRTQSYIGIPVFSVETQFKGYSEIVAVFNYESPNNFSLKSFAEILNPNYIATVMWVDEEYNVYRYKLWSGVGEVFFFDCPLYTGQLIKKNFRIEIWSVMPTDLQQFYYSGAGETNMNGELFVKQSQEVWEVAGGAFFYYTQLDTVTNIWGVYDGGSLLLYSVPATNFPFGVYTKEALGSNPPPFAYTVTTCSQASVVTFYTSVLGVFDYRYQDDFLLVANQPIVTDFSVFLDSGFLLPLTWPVDSVPTVNS